MRKEQYGDLIEFLKKEADIIRIDHYETGDMVIYLWDREFPITVYNDGKVEYDSDNEIHTMNWNGDAEFFYLVYCIMEEIETIMAKPVE